MGEAVFGSGQFGVDLFGLLTPQQKQADPSEQEWVRAALVRYIRDNPSAFPEFWLPILAGERTPYGNK